MFRPFIMVYDFCTNQSIPDNGNKETVKMIGLLGGKEIAKAYYDKSSPVLEKLSKLGLKYGHATNATVSLRWNFDTDPNVPFLEVLEVHSLEWD